MISVEDSDMQDDLKAQSGSNSDSLPEGEPDWVRLRQIAYEMEQAIDNGEWSKDLFEKLLKDSSEAALGDEDLYEDLLNNAEEDWFNGDTDAETDTDNA